MSDLAETPTRSRPGASVTLDIRQGRARAWRAVPFELIVRNPTPRDIAVDFDARDARGLCNFTLPRPLTVPAGLQATTRIWARPSRRRILGPTGMIPFVVTAFEPDGRAAEVGAKLPDLALGAIPLLLGVAGVAVIAGTASAGAMLTGGDDGGASTTLADPGATLTAAVAGASTKGTPAAEATRAATEPARTATTAAVTATTPVPTSTPTPTASPTPTPTPTATPTPSPEPTSAPSPSPPPTGTGGTFVVTLFCTEVGCTGPGGSLRPQGCTAGLMRSYVNFTLDTVPATVVVRWSGSNGVQVAEASAVHQAASGQTYIDVAGSFGADTYTVSWSVGSGGPIATATLTLTC